MIDCYGIMGDDQMESEQSERGSGSETTLGLSDDWLYRALASTRRRRLLYLLLVEAESTVDEIATVLAGWDATEAGTMATPDNYEQIVIELRHKHLPLLAEAGLVAYDSERSTVRIEPLDTAVSNLIDQSIEAERLPRR